VKNYIAKILILPVSIIIIGFIFTAFGAYTVRENRLRQSNELHRLEQQEKLNHAGQRLQNIFSLTYDSIRTMAMLPGIVRIGRHDKKINEDAVMSLQQLYNSIASHVAVSEIYIVPVDLEPDSLDPVTGKLQEPIITFDQIISGASADKSADGKKLDEVEIFEYREMKKQISWFLEHYPKRSSIAGLNYPALSSPEVVTCDNTEFSAEDLARSNDSPRKGIVYSVPFYGPGGELKGLVSAVLRTAVLSRTINLPGSLIESPDSGFTIGRKSEQNYSHPYAFFEQKQIVTNEPKPWTISYFVSGEDFLAAPAQAIIHGDFIYVLITGFAVTLLLAWGSSLLNSTRLKAQALAQEMTDVAQARQEALLGAGKMASLGEMASNLAHEINNPLTVILAKAETLKRNLKKEPLELETAIKDVDKIFTTGNRIMTIIKGLKAFSRNGERDPFTRVRVNDIITDTIDFCLQKYKEQGVALKISPVPAIEIEARATQISQVVLNLLNNALDAIAPLTDKWVMLEVTSIGTDRIQISVTDSGKGIPPEIAEKLSQPFFTTKEVGKGTGLGLSISRRIAKEHGGTLTLDTSSLNTRFVLEIPLRQTHDSAVIADQE